MIVAHIIMFIFGLILCIISKFQEYDNERLSSFFDGIGIGCISASAGGCFSTPPMIILAGLIFIITAIDFIFPKNDD